MKKKMLSGLVLALCLPWAALAQTEDAEELVEYQLLLDSIENSYIYTHGTIELPNGIASITVPDGYKYLSAPQAERVLTELWGNPPSDDLSLGFLLREDQLLLVDTGYVFNIQYEEIGFVEDDDAEDIDYDELLEDMQKESDTENKERVEQGYQAMHFVGWASQPHYDNSRKILYWAKEIQFGEDPINTLNYNIRILGRKGVLVMNAIATMPNLPLVEQDLPDVLNTVEFNQGYAYHDFNPDIDQVAAWSIGGLVAGKVLAKAGFFAVILKFWKVIALAVAGAGGAFWKKFKGEA